MVPVPPPKRFPALTGGGDLKQTWQYTLGMWHLTVPAESSPLGYYTYCTTCLQSRLLRCRQGENNPQNTSITYQTMWLS
jgi:hypothetical protein